jgi:hypothetical protein
MHSGFSVARTNADHQCQKPRLPAGGYRANGNLPKYRPAPTVSYRPETRKTKASQSPNFQNEANISFYLTRTYSNVARGRLVPLEGKQKSHQVIFLFLRKIKPQDQVKKLDRVCQG